MKADFLRTGCTAARANNIRKNISVERIACASLIALAIGFTSHSATAQTGASGDGYTGQSSEVFTEQNDDDAIVVTASRVARDGFSAPTPTTVIGAAQLEARGATNVSTVLYEIPAFRPTAPSSQGFAGSPPGVDLRGLGGDRTLTLMDGRRLVPSAGVDLNLIPTLVMERVEVVTGGASAQWGSDAVAGVVNFITKSKFTGLHANVQGGISRYGDYKEYNAGLLVGKGFGGGRGHLLLSGEFTRNDGTDTFYGRPWGQQEYILFNNPAPATNGLPLRWIASHAHLSTMTQGGIITSGPLRGTQFGPGGTPIPFQYGEYAGAVNMIGGDNHGNTFAKTLKYAPPTTRYSLYGRGDYEISDATSVFAEVLYGYSFVESAAIVAKDQGPVTLSPNASRANPLVIRIDNAFLPAGTRAEMERLGLSYINMGRFSDDLGAMNPDIKNRMLRVAVGAKGQLGGSWEWDAYYQYGQNKLSNIIDNNRVDANWLRAVDAVFVPATGAPAGLIPGTIVCRSTLTDPNNGCAPANIFGPNS